MNEWCPKSHIKSTERDIFFHHDIDLNIKTRHYPAGHIEFTWQQVMIGIQSSIIMFPINLLIVSIFRNTRPREKTTKAEQKAPKQGNTVRVSPSQTSSPQKEMKDITPDTVIKVKLQVSSLYHGRVVTRLFISDQYDMVCKLGHKENCSVTLKGHEESTATPGAPSWSAG